MNILCPGQATIIIIFVAYTFDITKLLTFYVKKLGKYLVIENRPFS